MDAFQWKNLSAEKNWNKSGGDSVNEVAENNIRGQSLNSDMTDFNSWFKILSLASLAPNR